jgi:hypothetical protein
MGKKRDDRGMNYVLDYQHQNGQTPMRSTCYNAGFKEGVREGKNEASRALSFATGKNAELVMEMRDKNYLIYDMLTTIHLLEHTYVNEETRKRLHEVRDRCAKFLNPSKSG